MDVQKNKKLLHAAEADRSNWTMRSNHDTTCFTAVEIERITDNYKTLIGSGVFGKVYKGVLEDRSMVAVKRFTYNVKEYLDKELIVHSHINHKNIVKLIGYCVEENCLMMVTEFIPNGNLAAILYHDNTPIPLDVRLRIATQCAEALAYMHSDMYTQVIHENIKPGNILLDGNLNAKISDFRISKLVNTEMMLYTGLGLGNRGYIDPMSTLDGLTAKSDVYSFGVVLLELLTRRNPATSFGESRIVTVFAKALASGGVREVRNLFDSKLDPSENKNVLDVVGKLVAECLEMESDKRPEMKDVARRLGNSVKASLEGKQRVPRKSKQAPLYIYTTENGFLRESKEQIQDADTSKWSEISHGIRCFTASEIERITEGYATVLGRGSFGNVYRGVLEDGRTVAVKRLIKNEPENFYQELTMHGESNHKNVVRLIGYCDEEDALMMVTEYVPNGNLCDALHRDNIPIPLDVRLRIALECAEALAYMHSKLDTQVIHGDIKPANILLDGNLSAKLSDFGISRLINTNNILYTQNITGSIGYMDPMFGQDGCLTVKSDVYSFGVLLFELFTRRKVKTTITDGEASSLLVLHEALARDIRGLGEMFDTEIATQSNMGILDEVGKLVGECLTIERDKRPGIIDAAERLRAMLRRKQGERAPAATPAPSPIRCFSFAVIKAVTNNFDEFLLVHQNPFGSVYRGRTRIDGGDAKVAVKRHHVSASYGNCEFGFALAMAQVCNSSRSSSSVPLIGYCLDKDDEIILVYDYMARGSLRDNLHSSQKVFLTWKRRLEICIGIARALHNLHRSRFIHCNVNTRDILLDEEWRAKISDLGFCRIGLSTDKVPNRWTYGRVDPEYFRADRLTEKSDVYCFGALLLEVLCARPIVEHIPPRLFVNNVSWALQFVTAGNLDQIVDPHLYGEIQPPCLQQFADIACKCLADRSEDRPSMENVASELDPALLLQEASECSGS